MRSLVQRRRKALVTKAEVPRTDSSPLAKTRLAARRRHSNRDEVGASLLLALIFLTVISVTVGSLLGFIGGGLRDSIAFKDARTTQSAANSTAELAMQNVRYNFATNTINSPNPQGCTNSMPGLLNLLPMQAYCRTQWSQASGSRTVIISVCLNGVDPLACENRPLLQAGIYLNDNSVSSKNNCTPGSSGPVSKTTCGSGLSVVSWVFDATPPTVTSVAPPTPPTANSCTQASAGALPFVVTGTGFLYTGGVKPEVFLVDPATYSVAPATQISIINGSTIDACSPTGTGVNKNFPVIVTTPSGTSAYNSGSNNGFTY